MARATAAHLRKAREKAVSIEVDGVPTEFVIARLKRGQRNRIMAECEDEFGMVRLDPAYDLLAEMCSVDPDLSADDVADMDHAEVTELAEQIALHSKFLSVADVVTAAPEEGADDVKSFPASGSEAGVGSGVDTDSPGA